MRNKLPDAPPRLGHAKFLADVGTRLANHRGRDLHNVGHFLHCEGHHGKDANLEFAFSQGGLVVLNALNHIGIDFVVFLKNGIVGIRGLATANAGFQPPNNLSFGQVLLLRLFCTLCNSKVNLFRSRMIWVKIKFLIMFP